MEYINSELLSSLGIVVSLVLLGWRVYSKLDTKIDVKIDGLATKIDTLSTQQARLLGWIDGRFGTTEIPEGK